MAGRVSIKVPTNNRRRITSTKNISGVFAMPMIALPTITGICSRVIIAAKTVDVKTINIHTFVVMIDFLIISTRPLSVN